MKKLVSGIVFDGPENTGPEDCETNNEIVEKGFADRLFGHVDFPVSVTEIYSGYLHFAEVQSSTFATSGSP